FTVTYEEGRELIAVAAEADRLLSVFQNRRWDGDFLTVRKLIDEGRLGRIVSFESRFDRIRPQPKPGAWREGSEPGSGILFDLGPHLVDQALLLFGEPDRVRGDVRRERDSGEADDAFDLVMRYEKLRVTLGAGMLVRDRTPRFVIRGTAGAFVKYGLDPQESALGSGAVPGGEGWGLESPEAWGSLIDDGGSSRIETLPGNYPAFYENIRDAITTGAPLAVTAAEALAAIRVLELALADSRGEPLPALR
ncbi:MAG: Gfo/Idh/MocA family oxidoreductase, partial [Thermoanaerobaculia bacterium]